MTAYLFSRLGGKFTPKRERYGLKLNPDHSEITTEKKLSIYSIFGVIFLKIWEIRMTE